MAAVVRRVHGIGIIHIHTQVVPCTRVEPTISFSKSNLISSISSIEARTESRFPSRASFHSAAWALGSCCPSVSSLSTALECSRMAGQEEGEKVKGKVHYSHSV